MNKAQRDELIANISIMTRSNVINSATRGQWSTYIRALKSVFVNYGQLTMVAIHEHATLLSKDLYNKDRQVKMPNLDDEIDAIINGVTPLPPAATSNQPSDTELEIHPSSIRSEVVNFMGSMANMITTHKEEMETLQNDCYDAIQSMITSSSELNLERATAFNEFNLNVQRAIAKASAVASNNDKHGFVMPLPSNDAAHVALKALLRNANPMHAGKAIRELAMNADTEAYALLVMIIKEIGREPEFSKYIKAGKK